MIVPYDAQGAGVCQGMERKEFLRRRVLVDNGQKRAILYRFFNVFTTFFNSTNLRVLL